MSENSAEVLPVAGEQAILARRYAGALVDLAEKEGAVDTVADAMAGLRRLWQESAEWRFVATDPRLDLDTLVQAAAQVAAAANLGTLTAHFLGVVAQNRRLDLLPLMINMFFEEVSARRGEAQAVVRVARPLSPTQQDSLAQALSAVVGGAVRLSVAQDDSLIGGMTVKIGSRFLDASVKTKLEHLERSLKTAGVAA